MSEALERIHSGLLSTTEQLLKRSRRRGFSEHLHPRDGHGRFARKPGGSAISAALDRADRANSKGAVIGGPEAYFDALRRMVVGLGQDANPRVASLVADHSPRGITGTHGRHTPEHAVAVPHLAINSVPKVEEPEWDSPDEQFLDWALQGGKVRIDTMNRMIGDWGGEEWLETEVTNEKARRAFRAVSRNSKNSKTVREMAHSALNYKAPKREPKPDLPPPASLEPELHDFIGRESAAIDQLKSGKKVSPETARRFLNARQQLQISYLVRDPLGMAGPPDVLSPEQRKAAAEYEAALQQLEDELKRKK